MKQCSKILSVVGLGVFVIGIVILLNAANIGIDSANVAVQNAGGSMDGDRYSYIMTSTTTAYMICGAIVSAIGGLAAVVFGYLEVKNSVESENENEQ